MARKRGGLAGLWDRNKHIIKPIASGAAGLLAGGPATAAVVGGLMSGLDRPGRRGIGFDMSDGLRGALRGATVGAGTKAGAALLGMGGSALLGKAGAAGVTGAAKGAAGAVGSAAKTAAGGGLRNLFTSKEAIAGLGQAATAGASILGSQRQAALEQERMDREQREAEARAQLMALFAPQILASYDRFGMGA